MRVRRLKNKCWGKGMNCKNGKDIKEKYRSGVENRTLKRNKRRLRKALKVNHRVERVLGVRIKSLVGDELLGLLGHDLHSPSV
jgi:hypothetical protein